MLSTSPRRRPRRRRPRRRSGGRRSWSAGAAAVADDHRLPARRRAPRASTGRTWLASSKTTRSNFGRARRQVRGDRQRAHQEDRLDRLDRVARALASSWRTGRCRVFFSNSRRRTPSCPPPSCLGRPRRCSLAEPRAVVPQGQPVELAEVADRRPRGPAVEPGQRRALAEGPRKQALEPSRGGRRRASRCPPPASPSPTSTTAPRPASPAAPGELVEGDQARQVVAACADQLASRASASSNGRVVEGVPATEPRGVVEFEESGERVEGLATGVEGFLGGLGLGRRPGDRRGLARRGRGPRRAAAPCGDRRAVAPPTSPGSPAPASPTAPPASVSRTGPTRAARRPSDASRWRLAGRSRRSGRVARRWLAGARARQSAAIRRLRLAVRPEANRHQRRPTVSRAWRVSPRSSSQAVGEREASSLAWISDRAAPASSTSCTSLGASKANRVGKVGPLGLGGLRHASRRPQERSASPTGRAGCPRPRAPASRAGRLASPCRGRDRRERWTPGSRRRRPGRRVVGEPPRTGDRGARPTAASRAWKLLDQGQGAPVVERVQASIAGTTIVGGGRRERLGAERGGPRRWPPVGSTPLAPTGVPIASQ